jgi:RNA recognition motif-containing protein
VAGSNLSFAVTEDTLKEFFQENKVRAIKVMIIRNDKGQSTGNAIIEFSSNQDADFVVKQLNNVELEGRQVYFKLHQGGAYRGSA